MYSFTKALAPQEVFSRPLHWAASNLIFYAVVASVAAGGFLAAARVHSYLNPVQVEPDIPTQTPLQFSPAVTQPSNSTPPAKLTPANSNEEILISGLGTFQAEKIVGTQVSAQKDKVSVGTVKAVFKDDVQTFAFIQAPQAWFPLGVSNEVILPTKRLIWNLKKDGSLIVYIPEDTVKDLKWMARNAPATVNVGGGSVTGSGGGAVDKRAPAMWLRD